MEGANDAFANKYLPLLEDIIAKEKEELEELTKTEQIIYKIIDAEVARFERAAEFHKVKIDFTKEENEALMEQMELQRQATEDIISGAVEAYNVMSTLTSGLYDARLGYIENDIKAEQDRLDQLKELHEEEEENLKNQLLQGLITKEEYGAAMEALDKEITAAQGDNMEELEKERRDILTQQAKAEKAMALLGIAVNTALAVAKVWGQTGIGGTVAQVAPIAMGIAQAAIVAATPIPTFATGGEFITEGPQTIMVGDNPSGREHVTIEPLGGGSRREDKQPLYATFVVNDREVFRWLTEASRNKQIKTYSGSIVD